MSQRNLPRERERRGQKLCSELLAVAPKEPALAPPTSSALRVASSGLLVLAIAILKFGGTDLQSPK